jgi:hypothetical protein
LTSTSLYRRPSVLGSPPWSARTVRWWFTVRDRLMVPASERGDVPGWVLVTLMTAGLVLALWALAGPALTGVFSDSIARVTGAIGG